MLKFACPEVSICDVRVRHSMGSEVATVQSRTAARSWQVQAFLPHGAGFELQQSETVLVDGFLYLYFLDTTERIYEFPVPAAAHAEGVQAPPSESAESSTTGSLGSFEFAESPAEVSE